MGQYMLSVHEVLCPVPSTEQRLTPSFLLEKTKMLTGLLCPEEFMPFSGSLCHEITWVKTIAYGEQEAFAGAPCLFVSSLFPR